MPSKVDPKLIYILIFGVLVMSVFPADVILPVIPSIATEFKVQQEVVTLNVTGYLIVFGIASALLGPLSDRFGRKPVMIAGLLVSMTGAIICGLSPSITYFYIGRILEAIGAACFGLLHAIIRDNFVGTKANSYRILVTTLSGIFISVAPIFGAFLGDEMGWRFLFYLFALISGVTIIICYSALKYEESTSEYELEKSDRKPGYGIWLKLVPYSCVGAVSFLYHFTFISLSPKIFMSWMNFTPYEFGLIMLLYGTSYLIGGYLSNYVSKSYGVHLQYYIGLITLLIGTALLQILHFSFTPFAIMTAMVVTTVGVAMVQPSTMTLALDSIPKKSAGTAVSCIVLTRFIVGGGVTSILALYFSKSPSSFAITYIILALFLLLFSFFTLNANQLKKEPVNV